MTYYTFSAIFIPMNTPELILVGGKPFSGKSTISRAYSQTEIDRVVKHLSMGDRLRAIGKGEIPSQFSDILCQSEKQLKAHSPVSKEIPIGVFEEFLEEEPADLVILDAYPRYQNRLDDFKESIQRVGTKVLAVCRIDVSDTVVLERSTSRAQRYEDVLEDKIFVDTLAVADPLTR